MNSKKKLIAAFSLSLCLLYVACYSQSREQNVTRFDANVAAENRTEKDTNLPAQEIAASPTPAKINKKKSNVQTATDLKSWIGKYPYNKDDKKFQNFFAVPQIKQKLMKVLGAEKYAEYAAPKTKSLQEPIKLEDGYLLVESHINSPDFSTVTHVLFAFQIERENTTHVYVVKDGKLNFFSDTQDNLPEEIEKKITVYADQ